LANKQAGNLIKQSFEQRAKRLGISNGNSSSESQLEQIKRLMYDKPFWIWSSDDHKKAFGREKGACCANHIFGLPEKYGKAHPLYDYEKTVLDAIEEIKQPDSKYRGVYCLKATGLGLTTLMLRYMAYLALRNDDLQTKNMAIITSPRLEVSLDLNRRLRSLFPDVIFDTKETVTELNKCRI
jgi:hypothetical protein